jgi:hypothetical protein
VHEPVGTGDHIDTSQEETENEHHGGVTIPCAMMYIDWVWWLWVNTCVDVWNKLEVRCATDGGLGSDLTKVDPYGIYSVKKCQNLAEIARSTNRPANIE